MTSVGHGIDLSSNNPHPINWDLLAPEVDVVWIKATQFTDYVNPFMLDDAVAAKARGKQVGLYHFAGNAPRLPVAIGTPDEEAAHLLAAVQGVPHDWLTLDYEPVGITTDPQWVDRFMALTGAAELYSYASRLDALKGVAPGRRRWVAAYDQSSVPGGTWGAWQYTNIGTIPGVSGPVDLSHVYFEATSPQPNSVTPTNPSIGDLLMDLGPRLTARLLYMLAFHHEPDTPTLDHGHYFLGQADTAPNRDVAMDTAGAWIFDHEKAP